MTRSHSTPPHAGTGPSTPLGTRAFPRLMVVLTLIVSALATVPAAHAASVTLNVTAHDDAAANAYWFTIEGIDGQSPDLELTPGDTVTVMFMNNGSQVHNFHVGGVIDEATDIINPGESRNLTFTVPATASAADKYWCDPHRALGMEGTLAFKTADTNGNTTQPPGNDTGSPTGGAEPTKTPGFPVAFALAAMAVAVAARRRRRE